MTMTPGTIRKVLDAFDSSDWDEIYLSSGGTEIHLVAVGATATSSPASTAPTSVSPAVAPPASTSLATQTLIAEPGAGGLVVSAPSMGLFYRAPSPGAAPFVEIGDHVEADTTICIVEVMKLMNPISAGQTGTVIGVHVENSARVVAGQPLFTIAAAEQPRQV